LKNEKMSIILIAGLLLLAFISLFAEDDEDESEMKFNELPKEVQKAFGKISELKLISEIESEKESENITVYEIEGTIDGKVVEIEISNDSDLEVEKGDEDEDDDDDD